MDENGKMLSDLDAMQLQIAIAVVETIDAQARELAARKVLAVAEKTAIVDMIKARYEIPDGGHIDLDTRKITLPVKPEETADAG